MKLAFSRISTPLAFLLACGNCFSTAGCTALSQEDPNNPDTTPIVLSVEESLSIMQELAQKYASEADLKELQAKATVKSIDDAVRLLQNDETTKFNASLEYLSELPGPDALALRCLTEVSWADSQRTLTAIFHEFGKRAENELRLLESRQQEGSLNEAELRRKKKNETIAEDYSKGEKATNTLSRYHADNAESLCEESLRQDPEQLIALEAMALVYGLDRRWADYDLAMRKLEAGNTRAPILDYIRGFESYSRFDTYDQARLLLMQALSKAPKLVKAQAKLLVVQDDIPGAYEELQRLKVMAPHHPVVILTKKVIEEEYQVRQSLASRQPK